MEDINDLNGRDLYGEIISAHLEQRSKGREPDSFARLCPAEASSARYHYYFSGGAHLTENRQMAIRRTPQVQIAYFI